MDEILKRLQQGEDAEAIAQEFTDQLNKAMQMKKELDRAEIARAEMAREAEKKAFEEMRMGDLQYILHLIEDWFDTYTGGDTGVPEVKVSLKASEVEPIIMEYIALADTIRKIPSIFYNNDKVDVKKVVESTSPSTNDFINSFFKKHNLI